jgi:hypothetical protein
MTYENEGALPVIESKDQHRGVQRPAVAWRRRRCSYMALIISLTSLIKSLSAMTESQGLRR